MQRETQKTQVVNYINLFDVESLKMVLGCLLARLGTIAWAT